MTETAKTEIRRITCDEARRLASGARVKGLNLDEGNCYYGLFEFGRLVSVASYKAVGKTVHLKSNFTLEGERNKGHMTELLEGIIGMNGFKRMKVYCLESSYRIYLRLGFKLVAVRKHKHFDTYIVERNDEDNS